MTSAAAVSPAPISRPSRRSRSRAPATLRRARAQGDRPVHAHDRSLLRLPRRIRRREVERGRAGQGVEHRDHSAGSNRRQRRRRVGRRRAGEAKPRQGQRERPEARFVAGKPCDRTPVVRLPHRSKPHARVGVGGGNPDHRARAAHAIPQAQGLDRPIQQRGEALRRPEPISPGGPRQRQRGLVAPLAVAAQPFDAVEAGVAAGPTQRRPHGRRMGQDRHAAEAGDVLQHVAAGAADHERQARQTQREHMSVVGADLDGVDA